MNMASRAPFLIEGHRGARGLWPENTLPGFAGAMAFDVDAIELDVAMTSDGVVVATHDLRLNPDLTRDASGDWLAPPGPPVLSLDATTLTRFDVGRARPGGEIARRFPQQRACDGARVPHLAEVMRLARDGRCVVDVELKSDPAQPDMTPPPAVMCDSVVAVARACGMLDRLALRSFDWRGLRHARDRWPELRLSWLTHADGPGPDDVAREAGLRGKTWAPDFRALDAAAVARVHALGLRVVPWTVNDVADMARLRAWGVDGFCTDRPDLARDGL